ncbi:MAG TPA: SLBB domain-containing protein [Sediminibacterium sp.]|nr:SLBB domain-containing protein [Sediminibacterium sp.]
MKLFRYRQSRVVLLLAATVFSFGVDAQTNHTGKSSMQLGKMSDQQIMQYWQKSQQSGLSESEAISQLVRSGMAPSDVNQFKKRLLQMQGFSRAANTGAKPFVKDSARFMQDSTWVEEVPLLKKRIRYYGYEYFSNPNPIMQPDLRIATPKHYVLGPGDQLSISLTGVNIKNLEPVVSPEGRIELEYAGIVSVSGLTIEQATEKIRGKLKAVYPGLSNGQTQLFIALGNIRSIRVTVIGEAEIPGDYVVNGLAGLFNVLYLSGGPTINGSLRKIELIRNNKVIQTIDFYQFLQKGLLDKHIRLEDQDIIRFPLYQKKLIMSGEVRRPAIYEMLEKETLADGIQYAGGFTENALKDLVKMVQANSRELQVRDIHAADFGYIIPRSGDSVYIDKILNTYTNRVVLSGAVYRPGNYELIKGLSLRQLIQKADGLKPEAFAGRGYIKRKDQQEAPVMVSFDVQRILDGTDADIALVREDSVVIASRDGLRNELTVTIGGAVKNPGQFTYRKGMQLEDLILMANGFTNDAANHKVEISRLEKNRSDTLANQLMQILTVDVDSALLGTANRITLEPQDYVFVPRLLNYRNLGSVKLGGEVLYAGDYALEKRNETVQEVIRRAGGITPYASMGNVQVYRKGLRVGTTILGKSETENQFLLQPGDSIYIPRNEPFVEVQGAVFNPQILSYESASFKRYISDAGGVTDKGNLKKAYIQYSNGINKKINRFLFFRSYPRVTAGSKIIVPEKSGNERKGLSIIEISAITGSLSALVSLISVLRK